MERSEITFLVNEYLDLWQAHGVECRFGKDAILKQLGKDAKPAAGRRPPENPPSLESLAQVREWLGECQRCQLCKGRNNIVFGDGNPAARLMFVGEGPGATEDMKGLPFVGRAGALLDKIIEAMGYRRQDVYIANTVKCRPPDNRTPLPAEIEQCLPFLKAQIELIRPQVIVALGLPAATTLVGKVTSMSQLRGKFHPLAWSDTIAVMPTYHPAYLLRNPPAKRFVWSDMKLVKARLETLQ